MITILITLEDNTTINLQAEHIRLRQEEGTVKVNGKLQDNGQTRFNLMGWVGMAEYTEFKSDSITDFQA